ncbi:MAG: baseplate protein, partial [Minisyncoccia bacterium]
MTLPIVETPRYELTLPSTDTKVQYRPFLVKEEKILYIALESGDEKQMQQATKDILRSVTFDKLNVEELPTFDVEYIFLQVRAKSVGEIAKFKIICPDDKKTYGDVEVDISKVEVQVDDAHTNNVILDEGRKLGVVMKYPNMKVLYTTKGVKSLSYEDIIGLITGCVDYIYEGEKNYPASES